MKTTKTAYEYHEELMNTEKELKSIISTLEYIDSAFEAIPENAPDTINIALTYAQTDLRNAEARLVARIKSIKEKLNNSYF